MTHRIASRLRVIAPFAATIVVACVAGSEGQSAQEPLTGVIRYEGPIRGPLRVAVFDSFPPRGRPVAEQRIESPRFPQEYSFDTLPHGRWFVLAIVDADAADGDRYNPSRDPGGAYGAYASPVAVTVDSFSAAQQIDITLQEPSESSPYRRRYR